ncbi:MAG TPA: P27 family phage terminase small subunit [Mycobacterium sp.]|jgi:P27 family predicted phage terminase small subunit|uniref:P27 family phage terminase small subunit n=1 Tax=Mycobacterium sp. TaxID=1785 RepID=UPI002F42C5E8
MARPTKPVEQKHLTGRAPGRDSGGRKIPTVTQMPGTDEAPDVPSELRTVAQAATCFIARGNDDGEPCSVCLADRGAETWTRLWSAGLSWLSISRDRDVLIRICRARIDEAHLRLVIEEDGPFVKGQRGGLVAHPAVAQLRALNAEVVKLESLCGFNPSDRGRLVAQEEPSAAVEDDIIARRTAPRRPAQVPGRSPARPRAVGARRN